MTSGPRVEYWGASAARGPLLVIEGVDGVGWDEVGEVRLDSGEVRHGVVLDVHRDWAVVEVFQGTEGLRLDEVRVSFSGSPLRVPVGEAWLGRVCNGRGDPLDGPPPILAREHRGVAGRPINPAVRETPRDPILTGVCAIDGLATLVRGQKLPIFSVGGLPHLELAAQVAAQAHVSEGEPFAVVFAAIGITHADAAGVQDSLEQRASSGDITLIVNTVDDPLVERIATPRIALTVAEHLAFDLGRHVLVVIADVTSYCEAVREVSAARGEVPSRRGYPGYLYSDLASIYERAGRVRSRPGSVTQLPVLTMPAGDITHPVPDLTGYITEGQLVLDQELHAKGVYPPFDPLGSLSRLMRLGAGPGRTRDDHLEIAAQLYALVARARQVADLADVIGADALAPGEQRLLAFSDAFNRDFLAQWATDSHSLEDTLEPPGASRRRCRDASSRWSRERRSTPTTHETRSTRMRLRTPPGRAGRPWLVRRLSVARRGADVLDDRRRALLRERARFAELGDEAQESWESAVREAETWLRRALLISGQRSFELARFHVPEPADVRMTWHRSLGVSYPTDADVRLPATPDLVAPGGSSALAAATSAYGRAVEAGAHLAAVATALERIDAELTATTRRLRALERRWIPAHEEALAALSLALDESEREDAIRGRWFVERRAADGQY